MKLNISHTNVLVKYGLSVIFLGLVFIPVYAQSLNESITRGKKIYNSECIACHMENGEGLPGAFPPLANSDYFKDDISKAVDAILNGLEGELVVNNETYFGVMDPLPLTNQELADVLNYIRNSWGGSAKELVANEIDKLK